MSQTTQNFVDALKMLIEEAGKLDEINMQDIKTKAIQNNGMLLNQVEHRLGAGLTDWKAGILGGKVQDSKGVEPVDIRLPEYMSASIQATEIEPSNFQLENYLLKVDSAFDEIDKLTNEQYDKSHGLGDVTRGVAAKLGWAEEDYKTVAIDYEYIDKLRAAKIEFNKNLKATKEPAKTTKTK